MGGMNIFKFCFTLCKPEDDVDNVAVDSPITIACCHSIVEIEDEDTNKKAVAPARKDIPDAVATRQLYKRTFTTQCVGVQTQDLKEK